MFVTLRLQTMSLQLTANAEYVRKRVEGRKADSHKRLVVLQTRGQKKYGWNEGAREKGTGSKNIAPSVYIQQVATVKNSFAPRT